MAGTSVTLKIFQILGPNFLQEFKIVGAEKCWIWLQVLLSQFNENWPKSLIFNFQSNFVSDEKLVIAITLPKYKAESCYWYHFVRPQMTSYTKILKF
jgi:hypothetical protein